MTETLPVDALVPEILSALDDRGVAVLRAPPGSGKTTRLPPALLDHLGPEAGAVWVLQPRRIAARSVARHLARERGQALGDEVGYQVRFDRCGGEDTRLMIVTEGILTRRLQRDPFLEGIAAVVLDEFHERSLHTDLALTLLRNVRDEARADLRIVVMSATLDPGPVAAFLGDAPVFTAELRQHPLDIRWNAERDDRPIEQQAAAAVRRELEREGGDLLVFLPGKSEIMRCGRLLDGLPRSGVTVLPLHGSLPPGEQDRALAPAPGRKVVLATNVAETSVTIPGVTCVIDGGLVRRLRHDPRRGLDRLELVRISQAAADQRAGRAGRLGPGRVVRLWTRPSHRELAQREVPEMQRLDLASPLLELCGFGLGDPVHIKWFEAPAAADLDRALSLLRILQALPARGFTPTARGRALLALPLAPRLGCLVLRAAELGQPRAGARVAALLSDRDPLHLADSDDRWPTGPSDVLLRLDLLDDRGASSREMDPGAARRIQRTADQILRALDRATFERAGSPIPVEEAVGRAILAAYPDRVARRIAPRSARARMVGGTSVDLVASSVVREAELFLAVDAAANRGSVPRLRMASALDPAWLEADQASALDESEEAHFDVAAQKVISRRTHRYRDLVLSSTEGGRPDPEAAARLLEQALRSRPELVDIWLPADEGILARITWLTSVLPELDLPPVDADARLEAFAALCAGRRSFEELARAPATDVLLGALSHEQRQALDREAPANLTLASGARCPLRYESGRPPILRARVQQLFGTLETPRLARGRVACLVEILAPNQRPVQLTRDLASFWRETYARVRKDLRGRYPKHAWPERPPGPEASPTTRDDSARSRKR